MFSARAPAYDAPLPDPKRIEPMTRAAREIGWIVAAAVLAGAFVLAVMGAHLEPRPPTSDEFVAFVVIALMAITALRLIVWSIRREGDAPAILAFWRESLFLIGVGLLAYACAERYPA